MDFRRCSAQELRCHCPAHAGSNLASCELENKNNRRGFESSSADITVSHIPGLSHGSYLLTYDAIAFNQLLETVLITNTPAPGSTRQNHSPWLFLDAAHTVFSTAKERVYLKQSAKAEATPLPGDVTQGITVVLEELPKWGTVKEVLEEIENEIHLDPQHGMSFYIQLTNFR